MPSPQFFNLPKEKQQQIIDASLREFAERGYDLASTNRIVEQAHISKGVLFKYFADKESLFLYVVETTLQRYLEAFPQQEVHAFADPFEWLRDVAVRKMRFHQEHPVIYRLWTRITKEPQHPVYAKVMQVANLTSHQYLETVASLFPRDRLRNGCTWEQVLFAVEWIGRGLLERYQTEIPEAVDEGFERAFQHLLEEFDSYLEIIKRGVYGGA